MQYDSFLTAVLPEIAEPWDDGLESILRVLPADRCTPDSAWICLGLDDMKWYAQVSEINDELAKLPRAPDMAALARAIGAPGITSAHKPEDFATLMAMVFPEFRMQAIERLTSAFQWNVTPQIQEVIFPKDAIYTTKESEKDLIRNFFAWHARAVRHDSAVRHYFGGSSGDAASFFFKPAELGLRARPWRHAPLSPVAKQSGCRPMPVFNPPSGIPDSMSLDQFMAQLGQQDDSEEEEEENDE